MPVQLKISNLGRLFYAPHFAKSITKSHEVQITRAQMALQDRKWELLKHLGDQ